jgi:hypothetical protein
MPAAAMLPEYHYTHAALWALSLQDDKMQKDTTPLITSRAMESLRAAFAAGFRRLGLEEIERDRAFKALSKNPEFRKLLQSVRDGQAKAR